MSKLFLTSLFLIFSLLFQACSSSEDETQNANALLSTNEYVLTDTNNNQYVIVKSTEGFKLRGFEEKIILLDIFATWCPPCKAEASHLSSLQEKYADELLVLGISIEEGISNAKLQAFKDEFHAEYPMVNSTENSRIINAVTDELQLGRNFGIPLMALYKDGKRVNYYQGATEEEFIESDIKKALGK